MSEWTSCLTRRTLDFAVLSDSCGGNRITLDVFRAGDLADGTEEVVAMALAVSRWIVFPVHLPVGFLAVVNAAVGNLIAGWTGEIDVANKRSTVMKDVDWRGNVRNTAFRIGGKTERLSTDENNHSKEHRHDCLRNANTVWQILSVRVMFVKAYDCVTCDDLYA